LDNRFDGGHRGTPYVCSVLHESGNNGSSVFDRQKFPQQPWEWNQPLLSLWLQDCKTALNATVCDYSREGVSLKFEKEKPPELCEGQTVILEDAYIEEPFAASFIIDYFLRIKSYKIKRIEEGSQPIIGLQANLEGEERK